MTKASKGIGAIKKLNIVLPRQALLTIYKSFVRPHLNCGDILYYRRASRGGVPGIQTPALFQYSPNFALKFLNQFRRNDLKNQFKKQNNASRRLINF